MRIISITAAAILMVIMSSFSAVAQDVAGGQDVSAFREAMRLYDFGMYSHARTGFNDIADKSLSSDPEGFAVLSMVRARTEGYESAASEFLAENPHSPWAVTIRWHHAMNLFDAQDYKSAGAAFEEIKINQIGRKQRTEYFFRKAYCDLENHDLESAEKNFKAVDDEVYSDYTAPSRYALGYINYVQKDFRTAVKWFDEAKKDPRFTQMSNYYIMESRFMDGDHHFVTRNADAMYEAVPQERKPHLARIISESWLVLGDAGQARKYLELNTKAGGRPKTRSDWFFNGSVLYAVEDYKGAIEAFSMMGEKRDSIGQVASYQMGYSYIQTKNKVAAMGAFKDASSLYYNSVIAEDAYFNWAKLAFDLNNDTSVFQSYLERYPALEKGDRINSYINRHLHESITVEDLCRELHYGRSKIFSVYKKTTGTSINTYITQQRLERARQLLEKGNCTVTKVAEQVGFTSLQYFSRKFTEANGVTPSRYMELCRESEQI